MHQQAVAKKPFQEIRTVKREEDHPSTLYNKAMIQIYINERVDYTTKIMEDNDFLGFRKSPDKNKLKNLTSSGHRTAPRQGEIFSEQMEQELREKHSWNQPNNLLRTVYFLVGKHFALRICREHHDLRHEMGSQIKTVGMVQEKKVIYQKDLSKNNNGGLKHANNKAKTGTIFSTGGSYCPVEIIEKYMKKDPPKSKSFYCRPRENQREKTGSATKQLV